MKLIVLDPGHFHAALLQKTMYPDIDPTVRVYAEDGPELADYLSKIESYNARAKAPTAWRMEVHAGRDFLDRFSADKAGDIVVIAGNNRRKTEFITRAVDAGMHVLADKPMAIDTRGFEALQRAFADAEARRRAALRHHDRTPRDHDDAAKGVLADSVRLRRAPARFGAGTGGRQGKRPPFFEARLRRASQAARVVLRRRAARRRPGRHHDASRRPRAVGVLPRRDTAISTKTSGFSAPNAGPPASARRNSRK